VNTCTAISIPARARHPFLQESLCLLPSFLVSTGPCKDSFMRY
jgi:hypothetical protein